ncbi:hypothetical protein ACIHAX_31115 [Nocardia sp. NPDC051929]|uniref:hypothetical protein n=1 Tax=Nocardia sp. NPDC051929 TaxID=3364327 RepID=UPI0037C4FC44
MDPISLSVLLALITQAAAGEAGKSAWNGLARLTRRAFGDEHRADRALQRAQDDRDGAIDLAGHLMNGAAADPVLADLIRTWIDHTQQAAADEAVINTIGGQAQVHGHVVQARDIGNVQLGGRDNPAV